VGVLYGTLSALAAARYLDKVRHEHSVLATVPLAGPRPSPSASCSALCWRSRATCRVFR
jgi:hypothetical protein